MSLLSGPKLRVYKPFEYSWAYEFWKIQQKVHWLAEEIPMATDITQWHSLLNDDERQLLTQIFRFFTQADIEVRDAYAEHYIPRFKHTEILMMLTAFSNTETWHIDAYSHLIETVGMPEIEYSKFLDYKEMRDKHEFNQSQTSDNLHDLIRTMAVFGAFTEGLQLFGSFCILMNFPRFNKMKGMGQIIAYSVRDESLHCEGVIRLMETLIVENPKIWTKKLSKEILENCKTVVYLEDAFIDLAFKGIKIHGQEPEDVKKYIRYLADRRLARLKIQPIYGIKENPVPWMDEMLNAVEYANFFEIRPTEYSKSGLTGKWDSDAFSIED